MTKNKPPLDVGKQLRTALFKGLLVPVLTFLFFLAAPHLLERKIHSQINHAIDYDRRLSASQRQEALVKTGAINYEEVCLNCPPGMEKTHDAFKAAGVVGEFKRLQWGLYLSGALVVILGAAVFTIWDLNKKAQTAQATLIRNYQAAWRIAVGAALLNVFLLIPLLAGGTFEFSVLLTGQYFPKLILVIVVGGIFALWTSARVLLRPIPLEFKEPMSRAVTPEEAPELWRATREAALRLQTNPPDCIIIGQQLNFYVTELAVQHNGGKTAGRTLFLSLPLLKELSESEVQAIIGHELGHFLGEDTRMTRQFYPLRLKTHATTMAMARSGWVGWPSFYLLNSFALCFAPTEQTASRRRELLADSKAAFLTSNAIAAQALVRFHVLNEAFQRGLKSALASNEQKPLNFSLQSIVREQLADEPNFWPKLFEKKLPHPLDSHPPLQVRLEALGHNISPEKAREIGTSQTAAAYGIWFDGRPALFEGLENQAQVAVEKMRLRTQITGADYRTAAGKELLDRHFPELKWKLRQGGIVFAAGLLTLLAIGCLLGAAKIDALAGRVIFGLLMVFLGFFACNIWLRHRRAILTLNADGLHYSGWKRALQFRDVEKILARKTYGNVQLIFRLKAKQPPLWKLSALPIGSRQFVLSLNGYGEKQPKLAQIIFRYLTRQIEEPAPAK